jgi:hypothetical protein
VIIVTEKHTMLSNWSDLLLTQVSSIILTLARASLNMFYVSLHTVSKVPDKPPRS